MNAPFYPMGAFGDGASLAVAFVLGIGFGFFLERAGFGSARKLVSQFYLNDMAVLKVMFTAIITAMTGLWALAHFGLLDPDLLALTPTNLWPQVVGGLVLGAGFLIGGYCPGTSIVAAVSGALDGVGFVAGVLLGTYFVGESWPLLQGFAASSDLGTLTLPEVLHLPPGAVVALVLAMAIGAFVAAQAIERRFPAPPDADDA